MKFVLNLSVSNLIGNRKEFSRFSNDARALSIYQKVVCSEMGFVYGISKTKTLLLLIVLLFSSLSDLVLRCHEHIMSKLDK